MVINVTITMAINIIIGTIIIPTIIIIVLFGKYLVPIRLLLLLVVLYSFGSTGTLQSEVKQGLPTQLSRCF